MANTLIEKVRAVVSLEIEIWTDDFQHAINGHPEVTLDKVRDTLKGPSKVIQSNSSKNACLFYSVEIKVNEDNILFFCVVVGVTGPGPGPGRGKMITAYDAEFVKSGTELYSKK